MTEPMIDVGGGDKVTRARKDAARVMLADLATQAEDRDWVGVAFMVSVVVFELGEGLVPLIAVYTRRESLRVDEEGVTMACAPLMLTQPS